MEGNRRCASVRMSILTVRASLPDLDETQVLQDGRDFARLENRNVRHSSGYLHHLCTDEVAFELGIAVLEQHGDDLLQVPVKLVHGLAL